ncbi:unnamed protein product, partial [marine sediment metagenome]
MPQCGDHDVHPLRGFTGVMWYPYDSCDTYARYNILSTTEFDIGRMEIFDTDWEEPHGSWDLRMLGPSDSYGFKCGVHAL